MQWRILFVLEYFHPHVGGVETLFAGLTTGLAARGHKVTVITSAVPGAPARETWQGVEIIREKVPHLGARYYFTLRSIPTVVRHARRHDIVHTTTYNAGIPGWIGARIARRRAVITVHEVWGDQWNSLLGMNRWVGWGYRAFEWLVLHLPFDEFHCVSRFTERRVRELMGVPAERTAVVYNAIDYEFWQREWPVDARPAGDDDTFVYCSFGRPGVSKGLEYLIDAAVIVRDRLPNSRLRMILAHDPISQYNRLRQRISDKGLGDYVEVVDPLPRHRLPSVLKSADCAVVPSLSEGFGYSALEAAVLGLPVIATTGHSLEEVLDGAVFVAPRDVEGLANAIVSVAKERTGRAAPAAHYGVDEQVDATLAAYEKLRARPGR